MPLYCKLTLYGYGAIGFEYDQALNTWELLYSKHVFFNLQLLQPPVSLKVTFSTELHLFGQAHNITGKKKKHTTVTMDDMESKQF